MAHSLRSMPLASTAAAVLTSTMLVVMPAKAIVAFVGTSTDSVNTFNIGWQWDSAGGAASYLGTNWSMLVAVIPGPGNYQIFTLYQHLNGPDGESAETWHVASAVRPFSPFSTLSVYTEDHLGSTPNSPAQHVNAHAVSFGLGVFSAAGGSGSLNVQHIAVIPEPPIALLMLGGLGWAAANSALRRRAQRSG